MFASKISPLTQLILLISNKLGIGGVDDGFGWQRWGVLLLDHGYPMNLRVRNQQMREFQIEDFTG